MTFSVGGVKPVLLYTLRAFAPPHISGSEPPHRSEQVELGGVDVDVRSWPLGSSVLPQKPVSN